jgi:hypothetical protein
MASIGPVMEPLSEICTVTGEVCGTPSAELRKAPKLRVSFTLLGAGSVIDV